MLVDSVIKSGGNEFHGDATFYGTNSTFEANNVDEELRSQGIRGTAKLHHQVDLSGGIGGRIIRNKLWFFGAASLKSYDREVLDAVDEAGNPIVLTTDMYYHVEKISYQMTPANRILGFYHKAQDTQVRDASRFVPAESRIKAYNPVDVGKVEWQGVRGSSLVTSVQHGFFDYSAIYDSPNPGKIATTDIATLYVTGDHVNDGKRNYEFRHHTKAVVSWYKSDLLPATMNSRGDSTTCFPGGASGRSRDWARTTSSSSTTERRSKSPPTTLRSRPGTTRDISACICRTPGRWPGG
jgi:hypothetical protein